MKQPAWSLLIASATFIPLIKVGTSGGLANGIKLTETSLRCDCMCFSRATTALHLFCSDNPEGKKRLSHFQEQYWQLVAGP
jgi:hypothetical protein